MTDLVDMNEDPLRGLTFGQEQFVLNYLANGGNASAAARDAGYGSAGVTGCRLLKTPKVAAAVDALRAERRAEIDMKLREKHLSPDRIYAELAAIAGFDIGELLTEGVIDPRKVTGEHTKALASVEAGKNGYKVKAHDKLAALRLLMDALGMIKQGPQVAVQVNLEFGERMEMRRARALEQTT